MRRHLMAASLIFAIVAGQIGVYASRRVPCRLPEEGRDHDNARLRRERRPSITSPRGATRLP